MPTSLLIYPSIHPCIMICLSSIYLASIIHPPVTYLSSVYFLPIIHPSITCHPCQTRLGWFWPPLHQCNTRGFTQHSLFVCISLLSLTMWNLILYLQDAYSFISSIHLQFCQVDELFGHLEFLTSLETLFCIILHHSYCFLLYWGWNPGGPQPFLSF